MEQVALEDRRGGSLTKWITPADIVRYLLTAAIALACAYAAYQVNLSQTQNRLIQLESKTMKIEEQMIRRIEMDTRFDALQKQLTIIHEDLRELRQEVKQTR